MLAVSGGGALGVDFADDGVALVHGEALGVIFLARQLHVLVQVALACRLNDGRADGRPTASLAQRLVAGNQLLQLLHS